MKDEIKSKLTGVIDDLMAGSLRLSSPLYQLQQIKKKLQARGYQSFDGDDILSELGAFQGVMLALHEKMLEVEQLLKP